MPSYNFLFSLIFQNKVSAPLAQLGAQQQQLVQQLQAVQRQYLLQSGLHPALHQHNGDTSKFLLLVFSAIRLREDEL